MNKIRCAISSIVLKGGLGLIVFVFSMSILMGSCSSETFSGLTAEKRLYRKGWNLNTSALQCHRSKKEPLEVKMVRVDQSPKSDYTDYFSDSTSEFTSQAGTIGGVRSKLPNFQSTLRSSVTLDDSDDELHMALTTNEKLKRKYFVKMAKDPEVPIATVGFVALMIALVNLVLLMWVPFIGVLSAILCIVFATKALKLDNKNTKSYGWASLIITAFTLVVSILMTLVLMFNLQLFGNI